MKSRTTSLFGALLFAMQATAFGQIYVTNIAQGCDAYHSLFLKSDGSLWAVGYNHFGELGDGTINNTSKPEEIVANSVTAIATGFEHSLFLKSDGSLWAMGRNQYGQLGDGTFSTVNRPEQIVASGVTAIAAGYGHSLFLKSDGSLWAMGWDANGELGDSKFFTSSPYGSNKPEQIVAGGVTAIAAGYEHSLFLKSDGSLWAMGYNGAGGLGDGTFNDSSQPEQIVASGVTAIAAGGYHSLFLKSDGSLWTMGYNAYGQLGGGTGNVNQPQEISTNGVIAIAGGNSHSLFVKSDGSLWGMGFNGHGELGDGTSNATNQPEKIVAGGVTAATGGYYHSLFLKSDGSLWAMGDNEYGQLGDGFVWIADQTATPEVVLPRPQPGLAQVCLSKTNLQFTATCGFGGTFYLLAGTNLVQPVSQWTRIKTNSITTRGANNFNVILTNAMSSGAGQKFYILQSP